MLHPIFVIIFVLLPQYVHNSCCRLPFTDGECQINRKGPHRYQIMPDRHSGIVTESTECYINDFDANYRKLIIKKNYCNDCPGLLIFHTNSSEIFLFPEYLERILEGRTQIQRKNVVILTTSLIGAYDLDFTFFSRYYSSRPINEVPSLYVDLQLPVYDPKQEIQPSLRLRLPNYNNDKEGLSKISRQELIYNGQTMSNVHQLPYIYHFDIEKHRHPPSQCTLYDVQVSSSSLIWKMLASEVSACHTNMSYFGRNKCFATGFTRLFCPIEESISLDDRLQLSSYFNTTNKVERLTIAVTGGRHIDMFLSNDQMTPAEQVKILLLQGHLIVADINTNLPIRVEYGWNCDDFSLVVPAGFSATRYRRFDGENLAIYEGNSIVPLPRCFRVIPNLVQIPSSSITSTLSSSTIDVKSDEKQIITSSLSEIKIIIQLNLTNITKDNQQNTSSNYWNIFPDYENLAYGTIILLVLVALIPLCLLVFYVVYCSQHDKSKSTLKHGSHTNPAYNSSKDDPNDISVLSYVNKSTQTTDNPIRI
ncbi:unnamed protein product [Rotaria sordida]|uniref:Envelope protein n=1 Tax=Rotaria sordida TaxID=392033 RepID=A0A813TTK9_9BILA|nr:unnamed protein product [Rotaria sordida]CAF0889381.1 unnamed protein product [Rotaria sordida]CAF3567555.1 unnamed protein product [Rotaria sordida]CAF3707625.1 unnamed protein product [Rotaria sordida]